MQRRGSLAWFGRQTHNLENKGANAHGPEVAGSNPAPGTIPNLDDLKNKSIQGLAKVAAYSTEMDGQFEGIRSVDYNKVQQKGVENAMKREKCLFHPAMKCPTPEEPCVFVGLGEPKGIERPPPTRPSK